MFHVTYANRYWTTLASLGCIPTDQTDLFLLVHSASSAAANASAASSRHESDEAWGDAEAAQAWWASTPLALRAAGLQYVRVDFTAAFAGSTYHGAWPSVAYWYGKQDTPIEREYFKEEINESANGEIH